ncbi:MAG: hypothetical protein IJ761_01125 [Bacteroidales bacterium]|nr:hypothetical protein [Bacteroidales bacterium]
MYDHLHIEDLHNALGNKREISFNDLFFFYRGYSPNIPVPTVKQRIHSLIEKGLIHKTGYGRYRFGGKPTFLPNVYTETQKIARLMDHRFPYVDYCQWDLAVANIFSQHLLNIQLLFVDVERDATESVYREIRDRYHNTVLYRNLSEELPYYDGCIVVRNIVSDAPIVDVDGLPMASIEKILVDFAIDRLFPFHNHELYSIYENALSSYAVNINRLLRYAGRRGRRDTIEDILNEIDY